MVVVAQLLRPIQLLLEIVVKQLKIYVDEYDLEQFSVMVVVMQK